MATLADRYRIERELGRGGMATVYLAQDLKHDRPVALKVLHPEIAATPGHRALPPRDPPHRPAPAPPHPAGLRLRRGGRPPLVHHALRPGRVAARPAQARDPAAGGDGGGDHPAGRSCPGLCPPRGRVHRDIKPENILLSEGQALVADFGVARAIGVGGGRGADRHRDGHRHPGLHGPEQASGGQVDGRTDVYALGSVLYEMLAGEPPFTGPTPQAIIAKRFAHPVPSLLPVRPNVPRALDDAIRKALAPVPADRFASAAQLAEAVGGASSPAIAAGEATSLAGRRFPTRRMIRNAAIALAGVSGDCGRLFHPPLTGAWLEEHASLHRCTQAAGPGSHRGLREPDPGFDARSGRDRGIPDRLRRISRSHRNVPCQGDGGVGAHAASRRPRGSTPRWRERSRFAKESRRWSPGKSPDRWELPALSTTRLGRDGGSAGRSSGDGP